MYVCMYEACSISDVSEVRVEVMGEGVAPPASLPVLSDERFNQLDEFDTQLSQSVPPNSGQAGMSSGSDFASNSQVSQSILQIVGQVRRRPAAKLIMVGGQFPQIVDRVQRHPVVNLLAVAKLAMVIQIPPNCGPGAAPPGGESVNRSQISSSHPILPNRGPGAAPPRGESSKHSQIGNSSASNLSNNNSSSQSSLNESNSAVNYYGSTVLSDSASSGPLVDSEMSQASDPRKRPSSEDSRKAKGRVKKLSKEDNPVPFLPGSISSAVRLASSRLARR